MCERTSEFNHLINTFGTNAVVTATKGAKKPISGSKSEFRHATADIAVGIHKTSAALAELTSLIKRQGLFDNSGDRINSLTAKIKEDIATLNMKCDAAQEHSCDKRRTSSQAAHHNTNVVTHLKTELLHTTKDFKDALELRSVKIKSQQERKNMLSGRSTLSPMMQLQSSDAQGSPTKYSNPYAALDPNTPYRPPDMYASIQEQEQQQLLVVPQQQEYYEAREQAVTEVEKTIHELGSLFKRLSTMINEQAELVDRIDDDIENAVTTTNKAHQALIKTYENISSNKPLYMKLSAILLVFIIFFVLFLM